MPRSTPILLALAVLARAAAAQSTPSTPPAPADGQRAVVSGVVFDSLSQHPLADVVVQLAPYPMSSGGAAYAGTTDSAGRFQIANVPAGRYMAGFFAPRVDSLGLNIPVRLLDVAGTSTSLYLAVPSAATIAGSICPARPAGDSSGMVLGRVRDADSDAPLVGSTVAVMWNEIVIDHGLRQRRRQVAATTGDDGWYAICGLPTDAVLTARAEQAGRASGFVAVRVPPRGLLLRYFLVSDDTATTASADSDAAAARGNATLSGTVRAHDGRPLSGAHVTVRGSRADAVTADAGTFTLTGLPAGTQSLEVRMLGYAPTSVSVDLRDGRTTPVEVTLEKAQQLEAVNVFGKPHHQKDFDDFMLRRRQGFGHFVTAAEIERRLPFSSTDIFRTIPGTMVTPSPDGYGFSLRGRGGCAMRVVLDGLELGPTDDLDAIVRPEDIAGVEVYAEEGDAPPQYRAPREGPPCGVVLVWTKRWMQ